MDDEAAVPITIVAHHIFGNVSTLKKSEVNIQKSPLDRLLRPVSLAGDALVRIPNNDII